MTELKEVFSIIKDWRLEHSDYFVKGFCGLVKDSIKEFVIDDSKTVLMFLDIFKNADNLNFRYLSSNNDNSIIYISFGVDADNIYVYEIEFSTIDETIHLKIFDNNFCVLGNFTILCRRIDIDKLFLLAEENTTEPEQPAEDAEAPTEENKQEFKVFGMPLSPLERTVFEEIENCFERYNEYAELARTAEYGAEYNGESAEEIARYGHLANEQIFNSDYLKELISQAGLDETYQAWLKERREREQNEISDIEAEENDI